MLSTLKEKTSDFGKKKKNSEIDTKFMRVICTILWKSYFLPSSLSVWTTKYLNDRYCFSRFNWAIISWFWYIKTDRLWWPTWIMMICSLWSLQLQLKTKSSTRWLPARITTFTWNDYAPILIMQNMEFAMNCAAWCLVETNCRWHPQQSIQAKRN